jgi:hypothetical protein
MADQKQSSPKPSWWSDFRNARGQYRRDFKIPDPIDSARSDAERVARAVKHYARRFKDRKGSR